MKISQIIDQLEKIKEKEGDLQVYSDLRSNPIIELVDEKIEFDKMQDFKNLNTRKFVFIY